MMKFIFFEKSEQGREEYFKRPLVREIRHYSWEELKKEKKWKRVIYFYAKVHFLQERRKSVMRTKHFVTGLVALALVGAGTPDVRAQGLDPTTVKVPAKFRYSVKFACGQAQEPKPCVEYRDGSGNSSWVCPDSTVPAGANSAQLVSGLYATAINVHNPNIGSTRSSGDDGTVVFAKKAAFALPWQKSGPVSQFERAILKANHAFEIDCEEIAATYMDSVPRDMGTPPPFPIFLKGFLVIMSPSELDVTAVYTARPLTTGVSTIDVEVIEPRKQEYVIQAEIPSDIPSD
jgi:hypothetical protein